MLKKALMIVSGSAFVSALGLVRNLVIARILSPEDYGIASTLAISMSIVEMMSYFGLQLLIVVDKDGDDPHFQRATQGFQVLRAVFSAVVMFLIARPYAAFLGVEHVAWAYEVMALVPLIYGFQHYDIHRLKRHMNFRPAILSQTVPAVAGLVAVWPLASAFGDYRVMLGSILVQALATVAIAHAVSERPYRLSLDLALIRRAMGFGWPLLLNGILLFGVFNGEKLIVGRELGMAVLAVFSMGFTLTLTPTLVLASSVQSLFLPRLSAVQDNPAEFNRIGAITMEASLSVGLLLVLGTALVGGPVVSLLLGEKYSSILAILMPLAILQGIRSAKTGCAVVALARKRSGNAIAGNVARVAALPLAWWIAISTGDVIAIIWVGVLAEIVGLTVALYLVRRRAGLSLRPVLRTMSLTALAYAIAGALATSHPAEAGFVENLHLGHLAIAIACAAALASMGGLRRFLLFRLRGRGAA
jgi:O-antigen/teichoic acid export membrane protein